MNQPTLAESHLPLPYESGIISRGASEGGGPGTTRVIGRAGGCLNSNFQSMSGSKEPMSPSVHEANTLARTAGHDDEAVRRGRVVAACEQGSEAEVGTEAMIVGQVRIGLAQPSPLEFFNEPPTDTNRTTHLLFHKRCQAQLPPSMDAAQPASASDPDDQKSESGIQTTLSGPSSQGLLGYRESIGSPDLSGPSRHAEPSLESESGAPSLPTKQRRSRVLRNPALQPTDPLTSCFFDDPHASLTDLVEELCTRKFPRRVLYRYRRRKRLHIVEDLHTGSRLCTTEHEPEPVVLTYADFWDRVRWVARGLEKLTSGIDADVSGRGGPARAASDPVFVGLFLNTSFEWMAMMHGSLLSGSPIVTVYANLGIDSLIACINETRLGVLVCDLDQIDDVRNRVAPECPSLRCVIVAGPGNHRAVKTAAAAEDLRVLTFETLLQSGRDELEGPSPAAFGSRHSKQELAVVMYTSGTTGKCKGVMMTHANLIAAGKACMQLVSIKPNDVYLSYLPLAHSMELVIHNAWLSTGASIGFGSPRSLIAKEGGALITGDMEFIRPTLFVGVPRVFDAITKGVQAKVRALGAVKRSLFNWTIRRALKVLRRTGRRSSVDVFLSKKIFKKIRALFGGRLRFIAVGGAPISSESQEMLQVFLGGKAEIVQGYGLTETCIGGLCQVANDNFRTLSVGHPWRCAEVCLEDVPEMDYYVDGKPPEEEEEEEEEEGEVPQRRPKKARPGGEILIRGPSVTLGYFRRPDLTKAVFEPPEQGEEFGWFHTGDIGCINDDGTVSIVDRKKTIVKLAGGEYVALANLEMIYSASSFVLPNGICVVANSFESYLVAIVLPEPRYTVDWAVARRLARKKTAKVSEIIKTKAYLDAVLESFQSIHKAKDLKSLEKIRKILVFDHEWSPENGLMTASSKLKRRAIEERYSDELKELFGN